MIIRNPYNDIDIIDYTKMKISKKFNSSISDNFEYNTKLASTLYSLYIKNIISICKIYGYKYITKSSIIESEGSYSLNTLMNKKLFSFNVFDDLEDGDKNSIVNIYNSLKNGESLYQPILAIEDQIFDNRHNSKYHLYDGTHRYVAISRLIDTEFFPEYTLMPIITDESKNKFIRISLPEEMVPLLDNDICYNGGAYREIFTYTAIDGWRIKEIWLRGPINIMKTMIANSLICDYCYRVKNRNECYYEPSKIIHTPTDFTKMD